MKAISIPKEFTKGEELVILPRKVYERVLRLVETSKASKSIVDKGLKQALSEVKAGKTIGPFSSLSKGLRILKKTK